MTECAFIYIAKGLDPEKQCAVIPSDEINMNIFGCSTYEQAEEIAKAMAAKGVTAIDLCAGFGHEGVARVQKAAGKDVAVGAARFDLHPAFGFKSGDEMF